MQEGELLWTPPVDRFSDSHLSQFAKRARDSTGNEFADYDSLWRWSVTDLEGFWGSVWRYFDVVSDAPYHRALSGYGMEKSRW